MTYTGDWYGLYREGWGDEIVPDAYAHPAKFARGLIRRIYAHLFEFGYLRPGDTILDPFAGVGLGALDAMRLGCRWVGCEPEQKFVDLGTQNIDRWNARYRGLWPDTWGSAVLLQGDSRELGTVVEQVAAVVSSPPYIGSVNQSDQANDAEARIDRKAASVVDVTKPVNVGGPNSVLRQAQVYGQTEGQLGAMREGDLTAVITSPPYAVHTVHDTSMNDGAFAERMIAAGYSEDYIKRTFRASKGPGGNAQMSNYGTAPGQLAAMPEGQHAEALVSSPPYEADILSTFSQKSGKTTGTGMIGRGEFKVGVSQASANKEGYSLNPDNLGNADDFWHAARQIVDECYRVLAPGAVAVWVVKRFVRDKQIVPFPDQWRQMCEAAGFETVEWIRAWVVEDKGTQIDLFGNHHKQTVERKSFFRRLYESKYPENSIDWEDVLIMRRLR